MQRLERTAGAAHKVGAGSARDWARHNRRQSRLPHLFAAPHLFAPCSVLHVRMHRQSHIVSFLVAGLCVLGFIRRWTAAKGLFDGLVPFVNSSPQREGGAEAYVAGVMEAHRRA